jgi:hypothetical protein
MAFEHKAESGDSKNDPWWTLSRIIQRSDKMALWYEGRRSGEASSLPQPGTMRRSWLWQNADTLAAVVTAIAALVALLYAHLQITEGRRAEREANANELWRETLRIGFDNPKLSDPSLKLADFDYDKLTWRQQELFQKYEIYVDTVLNASDEILEISPTEDWKTSLRIQLLAHRDYLLSPHFKQSGYPNQYGANLRSFLPEILNEP